MSAPDWAVEAHGLVKIFGSNRAVDHVDLFVRTGSVYGLLGPNGAGKTTAIRMLATLLRPDGGSARIFGHDIVREAHDGRLPPRQVLHLDVVALHDAGGAADALGQLLLQRRGGGGAAHSARPERVEVGDVAFQVLAEGGDGALELLEELVALPFPREVHIEGLLDEDLLAEDEVEELQSLLLPVPRRASASVAGVAAAFLIADLMRM